MKFAILSLAPLILAVYSFCVVLEGVNATVNGVSVPSHCVKVILSSIILIPVIAISPVGVSLSVILTVHTILGTPSLLNVISHSLLASSSSAIAVNVIDCVSL